jgi:hypothetical protein
MSRGDLKAEILTAMTVSGAMAHFHAKLLQLFVTDALSPDLPILCSFKEIPQNPLYGLANRIVFQYLEEHGMGFTLTSASSESRGQIAPDPSLSPDEALDLRADGMWIEDLVESWDEADRLANFQALKVRIRNRIGSLRGDRLEQKTSIKKSKPPAATSFERIDSFMEDWGAGSDSPPRSSAGVLTPARSPQVDDFDCTLEQEQPGLPVDAKQSSAPLGGYRPGAPSSRAPAVQNADRRKKVLSLMPAQAPPAAVDGSDDLDSLLDWQ